MSVGQRDEEILVLKDKISQSYFGIVYQLFFSVMYCKSKLIKW